MAFSVLDLDGKTWAGYKSRMVSQCYCPQSSYMVDEERDLAVIPLGGNGDLPRVRGDAPSYYCLFWKGLEIGFDGFYEEFFTKDATTIKMEIDKLYMPKKLEEDVSGIKQAITDSLEAYWTSGYRRPATFEIVFPNPTFR